MKAESIKVGGLYTAKVNGLTTTVRVDAIHTGRGVKGTSTYYNVTNVKTGRKTMFRSAAKFRSVADGSAVRPFARSLGTARNATTTPSATVHADPRDESERAFDAADDSSRAEEDEQRADPTTIPATTAPLADSSATKPGGATSAKTSLHSSFASRLAALRTTTSDDSPHVIVEARAGTGKTTTLVEGLKFVVAGRSPGKGVTVEGDQLTSIIPSPQQKAVWDAMAMSAGKAKTICFVAFNKSIATELQRRVPPGVDAMTMHSLGYRAVTRALGRQEPNQWVVQDIIADLLGMDGREAKRKKAATMAATEELVSLCKMNLADGTPEELDRLAAHYDVEMNGNRPEVYGLVPKVLERCKTPKGKINFDDMIWLPVVLGLHLTRYDLLLVDEAQDLNRCQQALAKKSGHRLILVGDPKQAIYGFAGADSESMARVARELGYSKCSDGPTHSFTTDLEYDQSGHTLNCEYCGEPKPERGCIILPLTVTRRCGKAIVAEARKLVPDFEAHESNPAGIVRTAKRASKERPVVKPEEDYSTQIGPGDFALCRINAPLISECFKFIRQGRKANIQGRDIGQGLIKTIDKLSGKNDSMTVPAFVAALSDWLSAETAKEQAKKYPSETRLTTLQDRYDCILCFSEGATTTGAMKRKVNDVFTDDKTSPGIKLSSIHKAKGLEARRVFILKANFGRRDRMQPWEVEQERNLEYVAITRAIEELVFVA